MWGYIIYIYIIYIIYLDVNNINRYLNFYILSSIFPRPETCEEDRDVRGGRLVDNLGNYNLSPAWGQHGDTFCLDKEQPHLDSFVTMKSRFHPANDFFSEIIFIKT